MRYYENIFSPGRIGRLTIKNRIVLAAMTTGYASFEGEVTERLIHYYCDRAAGGAGLIIVEAAIIDYPVGREGFGQIRLDHPQFIMGLKRLSDSIKAHGCRAFIQLLHAGRQTTLVVTEGMQPVAPSPIPCKIIKTMPRELSLPEIEEIIRKFIQGAEFAQRAGFEGVELHAAHGYLFNQFLSPESNRRSDAYGGPLENRARILIETCRQIRLKFPELAISVRLNIDDFTPQGLKPEESAQIAIMLEQNGVDVIDCSAGIYESGINCIEPAAYADGWRVYLAEAIRAKLTIPVMAGGIIRKPALAEAIVAEQRADFVFMARSMLADSQWANKARTGNIEAIRPCILCNNCIGSHYQGHSVSCTVNPAAGRETYFYRNPEKILSHVRVAVVGAGPAGMQAATVLRRWGAAVTIYEKSSKLGGMLNWAMLPPHKERIGELKEYMVRQLSCSGAKIMLDHTFNAEDCQYNPPDFIIVATGSLPRQPAIEGWDENFCLLPGAIFETQIDIKNKRLVIIGGGDTGCELADLLHRHHNHAVIVEEKATMAADMEKKNRRVLLDRLHKEQVVFMTNSRVVKIEPGQVTVSDEQGQAKTVPADYVIAATGFAADHELIRKIPADLRPFVFMIGDAIQPTGIKEAIYQAEMLVDSMVEQSRYISKARRETNDG